MNPAIVLACLRVSHAITKLPPMYQAVIEAAIDTNLNLLQAAGALGVPPATYRERFARGLSLLRNDLCHDPDITAYFESA